MFSPGAGSDEPAGSVISGSGGASVGFLRFIIHVAHMVMLTFDADPNSGTIHVNLVRTDLKYQS